MAKKANVKNGKTHKSVDALSAWVDAQEQEQGSHSEGHDVHGAILKLKALFGVMSAMGTGADTSVPSDDLGMLAHLATDLLGDIEAHHFGRA